MNGMNRPGGPYKLGQRFGPYVLEAFLGSGAFKSVYRARRDDGEVFALGFPHHQDPEGIAELEKELAVSSRLIHPNILRVYGIERHEGIAFLVMEYLEGESLSARLRRDHRLPQQEALRYAGLVAEALAFAHSLRILHRDVKPANIFLAGAGTPKLLDFGIARVLAHTSSVASTRVGTVAYMAPEQFQGAAGTNADLWSLGVTFYEMLTGQRPFNGETGELMHAIMYSPLDESALLEAEVDVRLIRVLRRMLDKDPERRYLTAEELANELELIARRTRSVRGDEGRLETTIRASLPLVYVVSWEEQRVLDAVRRIAGRLGEERRRERHVLVWSASRGLRDSQGNLTSERTIEDPTAALVHAIESPDDAIYVFLDIHRHFSPVTVRLIRDTARAVRTTRKSVIFLSPRYALPDELDKEVTLFAYGLPDQEEFEPLLNGILADLKTGGQESRLSADDRQVLLRALSGLTMAEAGRALRAVAIRENGISSTTPRLVAEAKSQIIRKSGILEYYHNSETMADIGGLENLRHWFAERYPAFARTARYAGLPVPKGLLLVGVPGCGKSLAARALAGTWGVPLLRLDVGRIFGSIVGASEANLRMAIATAEAVSPCILWVDEIEKGFAGVSGPVSGRVAARVFGSFLSWLQDKTSPVFVVATANEIRRLPPELLRKGRFDEIFFVGLPDSSEREAILRIHLAKRHRDPAKFNLTEVVKATDGFSGAEIEHCIHDGLFYAFDQGRELQTADIVAAAGRTYPLSRSRAREIAEITRWAAVNARQASVS